jgi:hypothetical protein
MPALDRQDPPRGILQPAWDKLKSGTAAVVGSRGDYGGLSRYPSLDATFGKCAPPPYKTVLIGVNLPTASQLAEPHGRKFDKRLAYMWRHLQAEDKKNERLVPLFELLDAEKQKIQVRPVFGRGRENRQHTLG